MKSKPSDSGRAGSETDPREDPHRDFSGESSDDTVLLPNEVPAPPTVILRARGQWRVPVFVLPVLAALVVVATGRWSGIVLLVVALPFTPALWIRIEMDESSIRRRDWRGRTSTVMFDSVDALRLRRLPFAALEWLPRGYRVGRFWSVPLTLRLQHGEDVSFEMRCVWWDGWRDVARYVAARPGMDLDARTRGRLGRYVGPIAFEVADQR
jgi:hypothetical protein